MGILEMLHLRRRTIFGEYVSPKVIRKLLSGGSEIRPPEVKHFQFVVILVDDTNPQQVSAMLSTVIDQLFQHHVSVTNMMPSLLVGLLGVPFPEGNSAEARRELVGALLRENGERIRIAHGECDAPVGMFGGHARWAYGAMIPGFSEILKKLVETKFGTAVEFPAESAGGRLPSA
jgi:hypothetical protein